MTAQGQEALQDALTEAEHYGSSWGKVGTPALRRAIAEQADLAGKLAAVRAVPVINGEFVDADVLYRALGEPKPGPAKLAGLDDELADSWRDRALHRTTEMACTLRERVAELEDDLRALTEVSNFQAGEIRRLLNQAAMRHFRYVIAGDAQRSLTVFCAQCYEDEDVPGDQAIVLIAAPNQETPVWAWTLEQLNAAARTHEHEHHTRPGRRRRRRHNRAARRARNQERDTMTTDALRNRQNRIIGTAGAAKRAAFLEALETAFATTPWRQVEVIDVARQIGASAGNFYQYFPNIEAAFDVIRDTALQRDGELPTHLQLIADLIDFERAELHTEDAA